MVALVIGMTGSLHRIWWLYLAVILIGTESRLHTVFHLLEEIARDTDRDPQTRREWLLEKKAEIEAELAELEGVDEAVPRLTEIQLKERFL